MVKENTMNWSEAEIHSTDKNNNKPGMNQTEIGLLPEDWDVELFLNISNRIGDGIHSTPTYKENEDYFFVNGNNLKNGKVLIDENTKTVSLEQFKIHKRELSNRTILLSINGTIGNIAFFKNEQIILGKSACYINLKNNVNKDFIYFLLQSTSVQKYFEENLTGSTIKNLGLGTISNTKIPLPPLPEQEAIAEALSDADAWIESLEQLIAKKRLIKQGAMQELLSPPCHPELVEGWEVKKLGEMSIIYTGKKNNQDKIENGAYPFFVRSQTVERINSYSFDGEAILIPGEGNLGSIVHYINGKFDFHQRVYKVSEFIGLNGKYLYWYFRMYFGNHAMQNSVKATVDSIRLPTLQDFKIRYPSLTEQTRIATILSDMDAELEALEGQLGKARKVKQGMMQELLTGRVRLV